MKLIKIFFILLVLLCSPNAFAGGKEYLQTGAPCNVDVTKSTEDEGPGETECPYCPMAGSSFVNLKWDLSNRGGVPNAYCSIQCAKGMTGCGGGNYKNGDGFLDGFRFVDGNLKIVDEVKIKRPSKDQRYQVFCCEGETLTGGVKTCKEGGKSVRSKKFYISSCTGWGTCGDEPRTIFLREPTQIGRALVSITTGLKEILNFGADPVACVQRETERVCSLTLDKLGPGGRLISSTVVSSSGDAASRILAEQFSAFELFVIRSSCRVAGGLVKQFEIRVFKTSI